MVPLKDRHELAVACNPRPTWPGLRDPYARDQDWALTRFRGHPGLHHTQYGSYFLKRRNEGAGSVELRNLWGRAEQAATDYGVSRSWDRPVMLQEWALKSTTDIWRFTVANGDGISTALDASYCRLIAICAPLPGLYRLIRDPLIDPRADPQTIRYAFGVIWLTLGRIPCATVYWPKGGIEVRLC